MSDVLSEIKDIVDKLLWRPMDSAPKDGTPILVWDGSFYGLAQYTDWAASDGPWRSVDDPGISHQALCWMPLPPPPGTFVNDDSITDGQSDTK